ncbi:hypothetical protein GA0074695_5133 [Micromonospora viridifaciens]|uniref:Uncharacterized protein n=1 Tax=Micromonospora viridifaciens TaxID=1881 RepID=A0A1C4Z5F7_MICVI|nr:hypothetical protein [Micromonospora viridifaciens]SCF28282.1 hypothetical protein GA0074695_5133 [Micromonospora viridifaciens]
MSAADVAGRSLAALVSLVLAGCATEPARLPDPIEIDGLTVVASYVAASGEGPVTVGPVTDRGASLTIFGACLGGGTMEISALDGEGLWLAKANIPCDGERHRGMDVRCIHASRQFNVVPELRDGVTAWEVYVTEGSPRDPDQ